MIAPGNGLFQAILAFAFVVATGYALGRIHQWYRDGARREQAYRNGYDLASDSMFDMAVRKRSAERSEPPAEWSDPPAEWSEPSVVTEHKAVGDTRRRIRTAGPARSELTAHIS